MTPRRAIRLLLGTLTTAVLCGSVGYAILGDVRGAMVAGCGVVFGIIGGYVVTKWVDRS